MINIDGNQILVFYSSVNHRRKDATGAFIPEAKAFARVHNVPKENMIAVDCVNQTPTQRRARVYEAIIGMQSFDVKAYVFFCHGWHNGIQMGFKKEHLKPLAKQIATYTGCETYIGLYTCLTAEGRITKTLKKTLKRLGLKVGSGTASDGGFADLLRDALSLEGVNTGWIDAHSTSGHTTWNPYQKRFPFYPARQAGWEISIGGHWLVEPKTTLWQPWRKQLREDQGYRLSTLLMNKNEIENGLKAQVVE